MFDLAPSYVMGGAFGAILFTLVLGLFYRTTKLKRPVEALPEPEQEDVPSSATTTHDPVDASSTYRPPYTPREAREQQNLERRKTGKCRYCEATATRPQPRRVQIVPVLDGVYRRLGVIPVARWRIELAGDPEVHKDVLCASHADIARAHLEKHTQEHSTDYADFVVKQRLEMDEFERYALDERMRDDAEALKRGKRKREAVATVVGINSKKQANGG